MKERCHICGRKMKERVDRCKVCKAHPDEQIISACQGVHNVNVLVNPRVNLVLTDRRLLIFEDVSVVGAQTGMHGGLVGGLIGAAADKIVEKSLGANGSLKLDIQLSAIQGMAVEDKQKKGVQVAVSVSGGKNVRFFIARAIADPSAAGGRFIEKLSRVANG